MPASSERIRVVNGYDEGAYTYYPVLIVGAGESGIAMGCRLREQLGFDQFRIFDRQAGLGGTWWINRYPGVACDIPAVFYSFSFAPNRKWSCFHPSGPEIIRYLHDVCEKYEIVDKIQLNTTVKEMRWLVEEEVWEVTLAHMVPGTGDWSEKERQKHISVHGEQSVYIKYEKVRAKVITSAAGGLVEPKDWPDTIPGSNTFKGDIFHSARWDQSANLDGKDVIVVGTGCSAAQLIPKLLEAPYNVKSLTQLMRSPPWVIPRIGPPFGQERYEMFIKIPGVARLFRTFMFLVTELEFQRTFFNTEYSIKGRKSLESALIRHMKKTVPEKYHEIMTPDYGVGCKRRIIDNAWFPDMNNPKFHLTTQPLTSVQPNGVTLGPGRTYPNPKDSNSKTPTDEVKLPADTIILANGFDVSTWLHPLKVVGKEGKQLQEVWDDRGGPQAYMGSAMDGFPNFFILFGPNTATGHSSVILASENMVEYTLKFLKPLLAGDVKTFEVKKDAEVSWTKDIQEQLKDTVWSTGGCHSWYKTEGGWNATAYPRSQFDYTIRCMFPKWSDWDISYTRKGLIKRRLMRTLRWTVFAACIVGVYRLRKGGGRLGDVLGLVKQFVKSNVSNILGEIQRRI